MAQPSLVQSAAAASSVNSPTTITPTLGSGSTQGNILLLVVAVTGTSPTVTTPANWTLIQSSVNSGISLYLFEIQNNLGGITSVAVTVSATNGGAVGALFEYAGDGVGLTGNIQTPEYTAATSGAGTSLPDLFYLKRIVNAQELNFVAAAAFVATFSNTQTGEFGANLIPANNQSSVATTNVRLECYQGFNPGPTTPTFALGLSAGGGCAMVVARFGGTGPRLGSTDGSVYSGSYSVG